jgi:hypothetical protein
LVPAFRQSPRDVAIDKNDERVWSAQAHVLGSADIEQGLRACSIEPLNKSRTRFMLALSTGQLQRYLGDLYWATVFGPRYVDLIGRDRLLASPAYETRELEYGGVYVQVTKDMLDPKRRPAEFDEARQSRVRIPEDSRRYATGAGTSSRGA